MKFLLGFLFVLLVSFSAVAQNVAPLETAAKQAILIDMATGTVLFAKDADARMATSSMVKIMTVYLTFEAIKDGKLKLDDTLPVSEYAWKQTGSRMFLKVGERAKVEDLIRGVVIQSGNDAAVVLAEALGGTEASFSVIMNTKAQALGMTNSHFMNATGMPDPNHYSTARDLATLGMAVMRDFPQQYHYFSELEFTYNNIKQGNRNPLLYHAGAGVDGLKTGHTDEGGFGLVGSSVRDGRRMIVVVNGLMDMQERADEPAKILDWGYREFGDFTIVKQGDTMTDGNVWLGVEKTVPVLAAKDVVLTLPRAARANVHTVLNVTQPLPAPIAKGQVVGSMKITAPNMNAIDVPLVAGADVAQLGFFARMMVKLHSVFSKHDAAG